MPVLRGRTGPGPLEDTVVSGKSLYNTTVSSYLDELMNIRLISGRVDCRYCEAVLEEYCSSHPLLSCHTRDLCDTKE